MAPIHAQVSAGHGQNTDNPGRVTRPGAGKLLKEVAGSTRLELATSGVTGRRSNQLNYDPARVKTQLDSAKAMSDNLRACAGLPAEARAPAAGEGWWAVQDLNL